MDGVEPLYTPSICLTEIKSKYLMEGRDLTERIKLIMERSLIIPIDSEIALLAAEIKQKHGLHTVDAIICAATKQRKLTLVTGDKHFEKLPDIENDLAALEALKRYTYMGGISQATTGEQPNSPTKLNKS